MSIKRGAKIGARQNYTRSEKTPDTAPLAHDDELDNIQRELMRLRFDPQYAHQKEANRRVDFKGMAGLIGCSRQHLYAVMKQDLRFKPSRHMRDRLLFIIDLIVNKGLRWHHYKKQWRPIMPDDSEPVIPPEMLPRERKVKKNFKKGDLHP